MGTAGTIQLPELGSVPEAEGTNWQLACTEDGLVAVAPDGTKHPFLAFVPLDEPLVSTDWDGDTKTTADDGVLDLSTVFGAPVGIKAVSLFVQVYLGTAGEYIRLRRASGTTNNTMLIRSQVNGQSNEQSGIVVCDANGDIYVNFSGSPEVTIRIAGYWI